MEAVIVIAVLCMGFTLYAMPFGITRVTAGEFFLMERSAVVKQYNDTTVAYSTQVAVTVYFFFWGFKYGLSNLIFIGTWFVGLFVFGMTSRRLASLLTNPKFDGSLFSLLAYSRRHLRWTMGALFIISLIGLLFTEVYMCAQFVESVTQARRVHEVFPQFYFWTSFAFLAFAVLWYCSLGGMRKVVTTDTWQLSIAYVGMAVFVASLGPAINKHLGTSAMWLVEFGMATLFGLMAFVPSLTSFIISKSFKSTMSSMSVLTLLALLSSSAVCLLPALTIHFNFITSNIIFPQPIWAIFLDPFGWAPVVGFTIINLIWQFSDYTAFHRLALLQLPSNELERARKIREGIFSTMLNSPLTWGLGIFAGVAVNASGVLPGSSTDVFNDFVNVAARLANGGNEFFRIGLIGLAAFLGSVMLSTVDTGFMSVALIIVRDIVGRSLGPGARFIVNLGVIAIMFSFAMVLVEMKIDVLVFLNAVYSWGLIFGGLALAHIFGKRIGIGWVYLSLGLGGAVGAVSAFNPLALPDSVALVFPSVAAIILSGLVVLVAPRQAANTNPGPK